MRQHGSAHALTATDPATVAVMQAFNEQLVAAGDVRILGRPYRGARPTIANEPVHRPADLAGKPLRGVPLQLWTTIVGGMGPIPKPIEVSGLPTALMTGTVVGQEKPLTVINANCLYRVQSVDCAAGRHQRGHWQQIGAADQEAIVATPDDLARETLATAGASQAEPIATLEGQGMTSITAADGLDIDALGAGGLARVTQDFPTSPPNMERIGVIDCQTVA